MGFLGWAVHRSSFICMGIWRYRNKKISEEAHWGLYSFTAKIVGEFKEFQKQHLEDFVRPLTYPSFSDVIPVGGTAHENHCGSRMIIKIKKGQFFPDLDGQLIAYKHKS